MGYYSDILKNTPIKRLTPVQVRELKSIRDNGCLDKCTAKTFNHLHAYGLICTVYEENKDSHLGITEKAEKLLVNR